MVWKNNTRIGQFELSTKICNICGFHNGKLTLADRECQCSECKTKHHRDINDTINIKKFALEKQNMIGIWHRRNYGKSLWTYWRWSGE